jgi:hypothetical protein
MHWTTIASIEGFGDPNHYFTKFNTGNAQTIPSETSQQVESVREALLAFAGPQSLDQLRFRYILPTQQFPSN